MIHQTNRLISDSHYKKANKWFTKQTDWQVIHITRKLSIGFIKHKDWHETFDLNIKCVMFIQLTWVLSTWKKHIRTSTACMGESIDDSVGWCTIRFLLAMLTIMGIWSTWF